KSNGISMSCNGLALGSTIYKLNSPRILRTSIILPPIVFVFKHKSAFDCLESFKKLIVATADAFACTFLISTNFGVPVEPDVLLLKLVELLCQFATKEATSS